MKRRSSKQYSMHCLNEESDLRTYEKHGILKFIMDLKDQGVVKYVGLSTHAPELANKVLDMKILDMMMFSINPMYDFGQGDYALGKYRRASDSVSSLRKRRRWNFCYEAV